MDDKNCIRPDGDRSNATEAAMFRLCQAINRVIVQPSCQISTLVHWNLLLGQSRGNAVRCTGNEQQMATRLGLFAMAAAVLRNFRL